MESRFLGIPLVIWFLLIGLVTLVDVPVFMWDNTTFDKLDKIEYLLKTNSVSVTPTPTVTPQASPSATLSPTMQFKKVYLSPVVTTAPLK